MKIVCKKLDMYMYLYLIYWQVIRAITYTYAHTSLLYQSSSISDNKNKIYYQTISNARRKNVFVTNARDDTDY